MFFPDIFAAGVQTFQDFFHICKKERKTDMPKKAIDIKGKRFGRLVALYPLEKRVKGCIVWRCRCDCGSETDVPVNSLNKGNTKSCGCLKKEAQKRVRDRLHVVDGTCVEWLRGRKTRRDNRTGYPGVFQRKNGRYSASIGFKKKIHYIGTYDTFDEAVEARKEAEKEMFGSFLQQYDKEHAECQK